MCLYFRDLGSVNNLWKCWVKFHSSWKREWNFIEISLKFHCNLINEISLMKFQFHTPRPRAKSRLEGEDREIMSGFALAGWQSPFTKEGGLLDSLLFFRREMTQQWHFISSWNKVIVKRALQSSRVILFSKILVPKYAFQFQESRCWTFVFLFYWTDLCATGAIILQSSDVFCFSLCILTNRWPGDHSSDAHTPPHACYWE
jgi:hypothetical protein